MLDSTDEPILKRFAGRRVLVLGDVMLDEYLFGDIERFSPEAPVPVVGQTRRTWVPGGAANTAANAAGLGAEVFLAGVVGNDEPAERLRQALAQRGIGGAGLLEDASRPTTSKTRIVGQGRQLLRIDREERALLSTELQEQLGCFVEERLGEVDACIISDYAKGVVSVRLTQRLIEAARRQGKPVVVDPKGTNGSKYRGATLVKPNLDEAGVRLRRAVAAGEMAWASRALLEHYGCRCVLLTCGAAGMSLFEQGQAPVHVPAQAREVYDVTGAGDTVAATLAVALAAGASFEQAARLASRAAGIIVGRLGTAAVGLEELVSGCFCDSDGGDAQPAPFRGIVGGREWCSGGVRGARMNESAGAACRSVSGGDRRRV